MADFVVIGAGVIGLMLAHQLSDTGAEVLLLDRGQCGQESSWAGGGIISPLYPWRYSEPITALASWSQEAYPKLVAQLQEETGIDSELVNSGLLLLQAEDAGAAFVWAQQHHRELHSLSAYGLSKCEPALGERFDQGLFMPHVAQIRNPRLVKALYASLSLRSNVEIRQQLEVRQFIRSGERILGLDTSDGRIDGDTFILCGGAWSSELLGAFPSNVSVTPVRGQMLLFAPNQIGLKRIAIYRQKYLIPRRDGRILAGSTLERAGFHKGTTQEAYDELYEIALHILPQLAQVPVELHWSGLRPGSPRNIPYIGPMPELSNLYVNAGHYRNGLVLAPAATRLMVDLLLKQPPIVDPTPYLPVPV